MSPNGRTSTTVSAAGAPLLELDRITRQFGSRLALDAASLVVRPGTVHAVLGENGAGKTTLLRIAFGMLQPEAGAIRWRGSAITIPSPSAALRRGIGMVHQHFTLVPAMTVAENVALGGRGAFNPKAAAARVRDTAARAGLAVDPDARVDSLPVGAQQRCEIVKALARDVGLLVLDEPTAVLAPQEAAELLRWMRGYADAGHAVVLITHKLRDALSVADDVTVLHRGRTVLASAASAQTERGLAAAMLGGDAGGDTHRARNADTRRVTGSATSGDTSFGSRADSMPSPLVEQAAASVTAETRVPDGWHAEPVVLSARDLSVRDARGVQRVRAASLSVHAGEIVGIAAVEGAGQYQLLRTIAGRLRPDSGAVTAPAAIGFVPEDRHHDALLLDAPLHENVALRGAGARRGRMAWGALRDATRDIMQAHDVRASGETALARTLSGGNQQKLVLGRELAGAPSAIVAENPTRGLDFRATAAVHAALRSARDAGAAVLLYSSDLDEVLLLSDRVYAMHEGTLQETPRDRDAIGRAMLGTRGRSGRG